MDWCYGKMFFFFILWNDEFISDYCSSKMPVYFLELSGDWCLLSNGFVMVSVRYLMYQEVLVSLSICLARAVFSLQMLMNVQTPQPALVARVSTLLAATPVSALRISSWIPPALDALVRDHSLCCPQGKFHRGAPSWLLRNKVLGHGKGLGQALQFPSHCPWLRSWNRAAGACPELMQHASSALLPEAAPWGLLELSTIYSKQETIFKFNKLESTSSWPQDGRQMKLWHEATHALGALSALGWVQLHDQWKCSCIRLQLLSNPNISLVLFV